MVKTLERHRNALCEKHVIVPFCCSHQMYRYLAGCFGLISCRHYLGMALYFGISWRRAATNMIKEIGTWSRYYPKQYIVPPKWMKSFFHIERRIIPRFLYFELLLSLFFLASGPINLMICIVAHYEKVVAGFLVFSCVCLSLINTIFFLITSFFFKKK